MKEKNVIGNGIIAKSVVGKSAWKDEYFFDINFYMDIAIVQERLFEKFANGWYFSTIEMWSIGIVKWTPWKVSIMQ